MTYTADELKVEVFPDINDKPIAPTPTKAGNGSHLVDKFNKLVDKVFEEPVVQETPDKWIYVNSAIYPEPGQKLIILVDSEETLSLPLLDYFELGDYFTIVLVRGLALEFDIMGKAVNGQVGAKVTITDKFTEINCIAVGGGDWIITPPSVLTFG